jgi:WD40 repeat protein
METHAARQQRRRRLAVAATIAFLIGVVAVISVLWVRSLHSEREAIAQAARAEASKLFALGQLEAENHPTAALAHAIKSLELADTSEVRKFALKMLWRGPTAFVLGTTEDIPPLFALPSLDGRWLLESGVNGRLRLWDNDGSEPRFLDGHEMNFVVGLFSQDSQRIFSLGLKTARIWALPDATESWRLDRDYLSAVPYDDRIVAWSPVEESRNGIQRRLVRSWPLEGGDAESLGVFQVATPIPFEAFHPVAVNKSLVYSSRGVLYELDLEADETEPPRQVASIEDFVISYYAPPDGDTLITSYASGALRLWSRPGDGQEFVVDRFFPGDPNNASNFMSVGPMGKWLAAGKSSGGSVDLWSLEAPVGAEPLALRRGDITRVHSAVFNPAASWLSTLDEFALTLWPVSRDYARVFRVPGEDFRSVVFDPNGEWVAASSTREQSQSVWLWPLAPTGQGGRKLLEDHCDFGVIRLVVAPDGENLFAPSTCGPPRLIPLSGDAIRVIPGLAGGPDGNAWSATFDASGDRIAAAVEASRGVEQIAVLELATGDVQLLERGDRWPIVGLDFTSDGDLLTGSIGSGLRRWDLDTGTSELLLEGNIVSVDVRPGGRYALLSRSTHHNLPVGEVLVYDLEEGTHRVLVSHGGAVALPIWHPDGDRIISPSLDGTIRVGPMSGEEPHLLLGHQEMVWSVDVDPTGRWIASASQDGTVRIWPMPEGQPLHSLPKDDLLERLKSLTNYRVVEDGTESSGYRIDYEKFAGWNREMPTW